MYTVADMNRLNAGALNLYKKLIGLLAGIINFGEPELLRGSGAALRVPTHLKDRGWNKALIVTDSGIMRIGLMDGMLKEMDRTGLEYVIFDGGVPDPPATIAEEAARAGTDAGCDCVIGFGGGSSLDTAKMTAVVMGRPGTDILRLEGMLKVRPPVMPLIAVPTTSGTGSECTIAAIITNPKTHSKMAIASPKILPKTAVLDPLLTAGLPASITAETGMDALTHAVEAYISTIPTAFTDDYARRAVKLIFENMETCVSGHGDAEARENLMMASYYGGAAFTRAMVGYVHAIAHNLGAVYHLPHGRANAIVLPHVLEASLDGCSRRLADLADLIGLEGADVREKATAFIAGIRRLNRAVGLPDVVTELTAADIGSIAKAACAETRRLHAPPVWFTPGELEAVLRGMMA